MILPLGQALGNPPAMSILGNKSKSHVQELSQGSKEGPLQQKGSREKQG